MGSWLERYLGLFLNFEYFGNLTWLAIPLFVYFVATIKKRKRWEMAVAFVFILSLVLLGIKGGWWNRYILTLYPFTLTAIFLLGWQLIKKRSHGFQIGVLAICGMAVFFNYDHFKDTYKPFWEYKVIVKDDRFPHGILKFINSIEDSSSESQFLVCSTRGLFYYYSNKKGIDSRDPRLQIFHRQKSKEAALDVLKNQLKVKYILLHWNFKAWWIQRLKNIVTNDCDLIYQDKYELSLYRIREKDLDRKDIKKDLDKERLENIFVNDSLLRNGSFENWTNGPFKNPDFFGGAGYVTQEDKEVKIGKYSAKITGDDFNLIQYLSNFEDYKEKKITCFAWVKTDVPNKYRIQIYNGIDSSFSFRHSGKGRWELLQVNHTVNPQAKFVKVRVIQAAKTGKADDVVYVDGALLLEGYWNINDLLSKHAIEEK